MIDIGTLITGAGDAIGYKARAQATLFSGQGQFMPVGECVERTIQNMLAHAYDYDHWVFAYSGGKDSSTVVSVIVTLLELGALPRPKSMTVMYADTRMELPPLQAAAREMMARLRAMGIRVIEVCAPMDERFYVYMFGRGVPPPSNTFRWCTPQIKVDPMTAAIGALLADMEGRVLTFTGVRRGESKTRDDRINLSCTRNGAECGQGWLQTDLPGELSDTFAPIDHWTLCMVWDWLKIFAPMSEFGAWPTPMIADGYGGEEDMRTGCIGCNLIAHDGALAAVLRLAGWDHLAPLLGLKRLYLELKKERHRKRQPGFQYRKDGTLQSNQQRMGPLTFDARLMGLETVLRIQSTVNADADRLGRAGIVLIDAEEEARIRELIALKPLAEWVDWRRAERRRLARSSEQRRQRRADPVPGACRIMTARICNLCAGTRYKDFAGLRMDLCDCVSDAPPVMLGYDAGGPEGDYGVVKIGPHTLYHADAYRLRDKLGYFDAEFMDPPYRFDNSGGGAFRKARGASDQIVAEYLDQGFDMSIINPLRAGAVVVFCHNDQLPELLDYINRRYLRFCVLGWIKKNPSPMCNKHYLADVEPFVHAWNHGSHPIGEHHDMHRWVTAGTMPAKVFGHPTVKPLDVMDKIMRNMSGRTIIDPFMGTGSTGVAALRRGKVFTGIEKNAKHFATAVERITAAWEQAQAA